MEYSHDSHYCRHRRRDRLVHHYLEAREKGVEVGGASDSLREDAVPGCEPCGTRL